MQYIVLGICVAAAWGITLVALKNWKGDKYLCDDCIFNKDKDCLKIERPKATTCTVYRSSTVNDYRM